MTRYVAFLRGINVGGHRKIAMADLRRIVGGITSDPDVRSYIASGNLLFDADETADSLADAITAGIKAASGFDVPVLVLDEDRMRAVMDNCPFPRDAGKLVHAYLCYDDPMLDMSGVDALRAPTEKVAVVRRTVWLHAPDGIGRSKLAAKLERLVGVETTTRNLNTVIKMVEMLDERRD